jgi:regulator of sigma E protease
VTALYVALALSLNAFAFFGARYAVGRRSGLSGLAETLGMRVRWPRASLVERLVFTGVGPAACYLVAGTLIAAGTGLAGKSVADEQSLRVVVWPDGPAARAGLRDGDRVESVDGAPVTDWDGLKRAIGAHRGEPVTVVVVRDGREVVLTPTADASGKIHVGPPIERVSIGALEAATLVLVGPAKVLAGAARSWLAYILRAPGAPELTTSAQMGNLFELASARFGDEVSFIGSLNAYYLWVVALLALLFFPRGPAA